jgi:hypothetical protein
MEIINFTRFYVRGEADEPVLEAHRAWVSESSSNERFQGGVLVALEDGDWLDVAIWSQPAPDLARVDELPPTALLDRFDGADIEILGQERGVLASEMTEAPECRREL